MGRFLSSQYVKKNVTVAVDKMANWLPRFGSWFTTLPFGKEFPFSVSFPMSQDFFHIPLVGLSIHFFFGSFEKVQWKTLPYCLGFMVPFYEADFILQPGLDLKRTVG